MRLARLRPRSIQQAIMYGASVGLVMLLCLAATSLISLFRYNSAINDLDYAVNRMPRKADLAYEFSRLLGPLALSAPNPQAAKDLRDDFVEIVDEVEAQWSEFRVKFDALPNSRQKQDGDRTTNHVLASLRTGLRELRANASALGGPQHEDARVHMIAEIHKLLGQMEFLTQPGDVRVPLNRSRRDYQRVGLIVAGITGFALLLFLSLVYFGFRGISRPIQEVVRGARRVAQREFDYRIDVHWPEEMAELAAAFNMMTCRFQEAEEELGNQVEERSRQLVRSERLADVGFIAAGVSHEINNPLHAIMGAAESLSGRLPQIARDDAPEEEVAAVREYLKMIGRQSERCSRITSMLKNFARKGDDRRMPTNLVSIVDEVLQLVGHLSKYRDRQIVFARSEAAVVDLNPSHIQQVVLNLVSNALESMDTGGRLEIRILDQIDFVVMEFEDNGCGLSADVRENLFEPFYTRRRDGGGTGLGLSITDRIVKEHDGTIEVFSDGVGQGSLFRVRLPRRATQSDAA